MSIVFPCDMPVGGVAQQKFQIQRADYLSPQNRGRVGSMQAGFPLWTTVITLANTDSDETDNWTVFRDSLRGAARLFYGCDLTRPFPRAYLSGFDGMTRAAGGGFSGSVLTWSLNADRDVISITGLPERFAISKRDLIGFKWGSGGTKRALVRAMEDVTGADDGTASVTVEPPVPGGDDVTLVPVDATLHFDNPKCLMRQVTQQTDLGALDALHSLGGQFAAIQDLMP